MTSGSNSTDGDGGKFDVGVASGNELLAFDSQPLLKRVQPVSGSKTADYAFKGPIAKETKYSRDYRLRSPGSTSEQPLEALP